MSELVAQPSKAGGNAVWLRRGLIGLAALLLLLAGLAWWALRSFDAERFQRSASEWMLAQHGRTLVFGGPATLQLWPQPAVAVRDVRLSEPGRPHQDFAVVGSAALSLKLDPLLREREFRIDSVSARSVSVRLQRDAAGRRNFADLLKHSGGDAGRGASPLVIESLELDDLSLQIDDVYAGVQGKLQVQKLALGAFGPGLRSPLKMQARAIFREPQIDAALDLQAQVHLAASQAGASPALQFDQTDLHLRGQGFDFENFDARLQAQSLRADYGAASGIHDDTVELQGVQIQFSGRRQGWQVDSGKLGLARLSFAMQQRVLQLEELALRLSGRHAATTLAAELQWPALKVQGDVMQGAALQGKLQLGGDQQLQLQLKSDAPSGAFERITVPGLQAQVDGRIGSSTLAGQAGATLLVQPLPLALVLNDLSLRLRLDDPALVPLQMALDGQARLAADNGSFRLAGTLNDQRVNAMLDARLDRVRPWFDLQADFGTLDLNRFTAPAQRGAAPAPVAAAAPVNLQPLRLADARLRINVARLLRAPYRVDDLQLQAGIDNGLLTVQRAGGQAWGGRFDASGSADAGSGRLALRFNGDGVDLRAMLADTTGYDGLRGRGRIEADLQGRGATVGAVRSALAGSVRLSLQPAAIRGVDLAQTLRGWRTASVDTVASSAATQTEFSRLDAGFQIRDGVARSDDLDGQSEFLRVSGEGNIDLGQGRLDYLLRTRVINTASGRAGPEMVMLNGVTVPVRLSGPFGNIEWQVNWGAVTAAVAALSVPNVARGTVGSVTRGATGVVRGATGLLRAIPGVAAASAPR
jgi:AsmA protein